MLAVRLIAPAAHGFGRSVGEDWISTQGTNVGNGSIFSYLQLKDDSARAVGGEGCCGKLRFGSA